MEQFHRGRHGVPAGSTIPLTAFQCAEFLHLGEANGRQTPQVVAQLLPGLLLLLQRRNLLLESLLLLPTLQLVHLVGQVSVPFSQMIDLLLVFPLGLPGARQLLRQPLLLLQALLLVQLVLPCCPGQFLETALILAKPLHPVVQVVQFLALHEALVP